MAVETSSACLILYLRAFAHAGPSASGTLSYSTVLGLLLRFQKWLHHLLLQEVFLDASVSPFLSPSTIWLTFGCYRNHNTGDMFGDFVPSRLETI